MRTVRIRYNVEKSSESCYLIDPYREGLEIKGERIINEESPEACFQEMKSVILQKVENQLDRWHSELFPLEEE